MFGYVKTDYLNLYVKDTILYQSMYCGLCKGIRKTCNVRGCFALSYDLAFYSVLMHNLLNVDVKVEKQKCILHWFRKRPIAVVDSLTERIARLNVILAFHKANDDVIDSNKGRIKKGFLKSAYKKAKKLEPTLNKIVEENYKYLLSLEKKGCDSLDMICDPFGNIMAEISKEIMGEKYTEEVRLLTYNLGKWIYLIDALDDYDKDIKNKNFNVFINIYKSKTKEELLSKHGQDIVTYFSLILNDIESFSKNIEYKFNHDLIDNVLQRGLKVNTKNIMECKKCKSISKY